MTKRRNPTIQQQLDRLNAPPKLRARRDLTVTRVCGCEIRPVGSEYVVTKDGVEVGRAATRQAAQIVACEAG